MKTLSKAILLVVIFISAVGIWYSPVLFKGRPAAIVRTNQLLARNISEYNVFSFESEKFVTLNTSRIKDEGAPSSDGQKLLPTISAKIYTYLGPLSDNQSALLAIVVSALTLVFFAALVLQIFGPVETIVFSLAYLLIPTLWLTSMEAGFYEYSLFFLSIGLFLFFGKLKWKPIILYISTGIFLALAISSRTAIALIMPTLLLWMWFYNKKSILPVFISFTATLIALSLMFQAIFGTSTNSYLALVGVKIEEHRDFWHIGHLYTDPYTYLYEKEDFLEMKRTEMNQGGMSALDTTQYLSNIESERVPFSSRFILNMSLLTGHLSKMVALEVVGGAFIFLLFLLGIKPLYEKDKKLTHFLLLWIVTTILLCSFVVLVQRNHIMDFGFAYALFTSLGVIYLAKLLSQNITIRNKTIPKIYWVLFLTLITSYHLLTSAHAAFARIWDQDSYRLLQRQTQALKNANLSTQDIVATPARVYQQHTLAYRTDTSMINFNENTIIKLLKENKLAFAFSEFEVTHTIGFNDLLNEQIASSTNVTIISTEDITLPEQERSRIKEWIMSLIR